jgi:hypothetical protein
MLTSNIDPLFHIRTHVTTSVLFMSRDTCARMRTYLAVRPLAHI